MKDNTVQTIAIVVAVTLAAFLVGVAPRSLYAQVLEAQILGSVTDSSGPSSPEPR